MKDKIVSSFDDAVADVFDGAVIAYSEWNATGLPQNLIGALTRKDVKDLTMVGTLFVPVRYAMEDSYSPVDLALQGKVKKVITAWATFQHRPGDPAGQLLENAFAGGQIELEATGLGNLVARLHAAAVGYGAVYVAVGVGTFLEEDKEKRVIDGKEYILEKPIKPDFGFVRARKADKLGNLIYRRVHRGMNPTVAMASKITIVEVDEIVEAGELDPDHIHTPHAYVDRIVKVPRGAPGTDGWFDYIRHKGFRPGAEQQDLYRTHQQLREAPNKEA